MNYENNKEKTPLLYYTPRYEALDPAEVSARCNVVFDSQKSEFRLVFMRRSYRIGFPKFYVRAEDENPDYSPLISMPEAQLLIMRYLIEASFFETKGKFLTFREMPWGAVYIAPFDGRCIKRLAFGFGGKPEPLEKAMSKIGAGTLSLGDFSYEFELLDGFKMQFILWQGDDEFPPSSQILFSDNFPMAFTAEDMAVIGDITIGTMKALSK